MHLGPRKRNARLREMRDEFSGAYQEQENILRMDEWWKIFVTVSGVWRETLSLEAHRECKQSFFF